MKNVHAMLKLAEIGPEDVVYDLGCGDGRLVITAARHYGASAVGIEIDPLRYAWCRMMVSLQGIGDRVTILHGKGEGRLRDVVKSLLSEHARVDEFGDAPLSQGGAGVTIAALSS